MIEFPFMVVLQWDGGETVLGRGDSLLELVESIPAELDKPHKPWLTKVLEGTYRLGIIDVRTGEVYDDAGVVVQHIKPAVAMAYHEREEGNG